MTSKRDRANLVRAPAELGISVPRVFHHLKRQILNNESNLNILKS
jgi:hypothetical protein